MVVMCLYYFDVILDVFWGVFFLVGFWLCGLVCWVFLLLMVEVVLVDFFVIIS